MIAISVIVCAHNPRRDYFRRVLEALRTQSMPTSEWELLLVDNASTEPLASWADVSWHEQGRHIQEPNLGLSWARICGLGLAKGGLLVFVDDDNVLRSDYLAHARSIASEHPELGAWGGNVELEFEQLPEEWTKRYWSLLAARVVSADAQGRSTHHDAAITPIGAGMCVRREVALVYREQWRKSSLRQLLERKGQALISGGDTDLALTACDMGLDNGLFARLNLIHLIPRHRVTEDYLLRLREGVATSSLLLQLVRGTPVKRLPQGLKWWTRVIYDCARKRGRTRRFYLAEVRGRRSALRAFTLAQPG